MIKTLHIAKVIKNDDIAAFPEAGREGRVQIYVEPLMKDWSTEHYPWARPFLGNNDSQGSLDIPEKDSLVWVVYEQEELMKNWFYLSYTSFKKKNIVQKVLTFLNGKFKLSASAGGLGLSSSYPDVKLNYYKNGIVIGVSSSETNPEVFIYHPSAFISIDKSGNIYSKAKEWTHYGDIVVKEGDIEISKGDVKIAEGDVDITKGKLDVGKDIKWNTQSTGTTASTHTHPTAVPGPPSPPTPGT